MSKREGYVACEELMAATGLSARAILSRVSVRGRTKWSRELTDCESGAAVLVPVPGNMNDSATDILLTHPNGRPYSKAELVEMLKSS